MRPHGGGEQEAVYPPLCFTYVRAHEPAFMDVLIYSVFVTPCGPAALQSWLIIDIVGAKYQL